MNVVIVAAICRARARRRRGSPGYGAQPTTDSRTDAGTTPATGDRTNDGLGAGAGQTSSDSPLTQIIDSAGRATAARQQDRRQGGATLAALAVKLLGELPRRSGFVLPAATGKSHSTGLQKADRNMRLSFGVIMASPG
jgi:hypothetical protein